MLLYASDGLNYVLLGFTPNSIFLDKRKNSSQKKKKKREKGKKWTHELPLFLFLLFRIVIHETLVSFEHAAFLCLELKHVPQSPTTVHSHSKNAIGN